MLKSLQEQLNRIATGKGFFAALDQSGGSTPAALEHYGINRGSFRNEPEMFAQVQAMRERIVTAPCFSGSKILAAILFEKTVGSSVDGERMCSFLWNKRGISSFLKVDEGLRSEEDGVQLMKPLENLPRLIELALDQQMIGTKMRSFIQGDSPEGIAAVVKQQFEYGRSIADAGLIPILEPEISTKLPDLSRSRAEDILAEELSRELDQLPPTVKVIIKLTLPVTPHLYDTLASQDNVLRVLALSGGFSRFDASARLMKNAPMIASFSRALLEDLRYAMTDDSFNQALSEAIDQIFDASTRRRPNVGCAVPVMDIVRGA